MVLCGYVDFECFFVYYVVDDVREDVFQFDLFGGQQVVQVLILCCVWFVFVVMVWVVFFQYDDVIEGFVEYFCCCDVCDVVVDDYCGVVVVVVYFGNVYVCVIQLSWGVVVCCFVGYEFFVV